MMIKEFDTRLGSERGDIYLEGVMQKQYIFYEDTLISNPKQVADMFNEVFSLGIRTEEYVYLVCLNSHGDLICVFEVSHGTLNASFLQPREVFQKALLCGAESILLVHNHTSGSVTPSQADCMTTERIREAGELIGIPLRDHIIVTRTNYYSFYENKEG